MRRIDFDLFRQHKAVAGVPRYIGLLTAGHAGVHIALFILDVDRDHLAGVQLDNNLAPVSIVGYVAHPCFCLDQAIGLR